MNRRKFSKILLSITLSYIKHSEKCSYLKKTYTPSSTIPTLDPTFEGYVHPTQTPHRSPSRYPSTDGYTYAPSERAFLGDLTRAPTATGFTYKPTSAIPSSPPSTRKPTATGFTYGPTETIPSSNPIRSPTWYGQTYFPTVSSPSTYPSAHPSITPTPFGFIYPTKMPTATPTLQPTVILFRQKKNVDFSCSGLFQIVYHIF